MSEPNKTALVELCIHCGHVGPQPAPPVISCCPEHTTDMVSERVAKEFNALAKRSYIQNQVVSEATKTLGILAVAHLEHNAERVGVILDKFCQEHVVVHDRRAIHH